jgi:hypothetical protein
VPLADSLPEGRRLYSYSVIPGGVESAQELKTAAGNDSVVAAHYAGFNIENARVVSIDQDRLVYVSYRMGNSVFWTNKKLLLRKGETILTDGKNEARTRCGNRISEEKQAPLAPSAAQPALDSFDYFPPVEAPLVAENMPLDGGLVPPGFTSPGNLGFPSPADHPAEFYPSPSFPFIPGPGKANTPSSSSLYTSTPGSGSGSSGSGTGTGTGGSGTGGSGTGGTGSGGSGSGGSGGSGGGTGGSGSGGGTQPISTPEPGTLLMLGLGVSALGLARKLRRS